MRKETKSIWIGQSVQVYVNLAMESATVVDIKGRGHTRPWSRRKGDEVLVRVTRTGREYAFVRRHVIVVETDE